MNNPESPFYLAIKHKRKPSDAVWYMNAPLGKNSIGQFLKTAAKRTGLQGNVTNHAVRKTSIGRLLDADVPPNYVAQLSGHKNLKSLDSYKSASLTHQRKMSLVLSRSEHMEHNASTTTSNALAVATASASTTEPNTSVYPPETPGAASAKVVPCKELYGVSNETNPYCSLGACGVGQWTLVMKIDGTKSTFHYDSHYWSNMATFNPEGGDTVFDTQETKLETYWNTPFSKICLGMNIHGEENPNFVVIDKVANSLYSLIADGQYRATSTGRDTWKTLIGPKASLQLNCNRKGFNAACSPGSSNARIGILGNEDNDCSKCDSRIGFGTGGYPDDSNTCGNEAKWKPDNGEKHIKAMGYVFVQ
ncbi:hypothetical protein ACROYT_G041203 [Oculina patagonica]